MYTSCIYNFNKVKHHYHTLSSSVKNVLLHQIKNFVKNNIESLFLIIYTFIYITLIYVQTFIETANLIQI